MRATHVVKHSATNSFSNYTHKPIPQINLTSAMFAADVFSVRLTWKFTCVRILGKNRTSVRRVGSVMLRRVI